MTPRRRVQLTLTALVGVTVVAVGLLGELLRWRASPVTGAAVAVTGLVAAVAGALALRILVVAGPPVTARRDLEPLEHPEPRPPAA